MNTQGMTLVMTDPSSHTPDQVDEFVLSIMHELVKHPQKVSEF